MRNGNFSRYYNTYSIIHSMNPLCKLLALLIFVAFLESYYSEFPECSETGYESESQNYIDDQE